MDILFFQFQPSKLLKLLLPRLFELQHLLVECLWGADFASDAPSASTTIER